MLEKCGLFFDPHCLGKVCFSSIKLSTFSWNYVLFAKVSTIWSHFLSENLTNHSQLQDVVGSVENLPRCVRPVSLLLSFSFFLSLSHSLSLSISLSLLSLSLSDFFFFTSCQSSLSCLQQESANRIAAPRTSELNSFSQTSGTESFHTARYIRINAFISLARTQNLLRNYVPACEM